MSRHTEATLISQAELKRVLSYNKDTGIFTWKLPSCLKMKPGDVAGNVMKNCGYIQICVNKRNYRAHRLAWFYVYGEWPPTHLDHRNRNRSDNRIDNLRLATVTQNAANSLRMSKVGKKGVDLLPHGRFRARIRNGKIRHIGVFETAEEAQEAYFKEAKKIFGQFARIGVDT